MNRFTDYLHKIQTLPPDVVVKKVFYKIKEKGRDIVDRVAIALLGTEITDEEFLRKAWNLKYRFQNPKELQQYFFQREHPRFLIDPSIISSHFRDISNKIIAEANKICEHIFDLLGSGEVNLGKTIDWHTDFKSNYKWNPR